MKIKTDFVTNSSSSSFVVVFPKQVETLDDVKPFIPDEEKAAVVFRDTMDQVPIKISITDDSNGEVFENDELLNVLKSIITRNTDEYTCDRIIEDLRDTMKDVFPSIIVPISRIDRVMMVLEQMDYDIIEESPEIRSMILKNKTGVIYMFHYADEDGEFWGEMEHGDIFKKLPYVRISHH